MRQPVTRKVLSLGFRVVSVLGTAALIGAADYYKLPDIQRIGRDLYRSAEVVIETRSCLHRPEGEEALLKYAGPGDFEIVWRDNSTCTVQRVAVLEVSRLYLETVAGGCTNVDWRYANGEGHIRTQYENAIKPIPAGDTTIPTLSGGLVMNPKSSGTAASISL
jgi:hypothetical protein